MGMELIYSTDLQTLLEIRRVTTVGRGMQMRELMRAQTAMQMRKVMKPQITTQVRQSLVSCMICCKKR